jgi:CheY-like chemotaxis protein
MERNRPTAPVLIVDDNPEVREALGALLESDGYRIVTAADGRDALDFLRRAEVLPSLVLLDLMMPLVDGWDFRAAQSRDARIAGIPVIVVSAHPLASFARNTGAAAVIAKPADPATLLAAVERYCARDPEPVAPTP